MGYDSEKGFTSVGVDPSWQKLLEQLSSKGFSKQDLEQNEDFIKDYVKQAGGIDNVSLPRLVLYRHRQEASRFLGISVCEADKNP